MAHKWLDVKQLVGRKLVTLDEKKPFEVLCITEETIIIHVHSTGRERNIARKEVEGAMTELDMRGEISRTEIQKQHSSRNPAYVAAMLAALPGVTYSLDPIILRTV